MFKIGKAFRFEAAHFLPNHDGKCQTLHGHSYAVEIVVCGDELMPEEKQSPDEGMLIDYAKIRSLVEPLVKGLDHQGLVQEHMDGRVSTAENMAHWLFCLLEVDLTSERYNLHSVTVKETADTFAEFTHRRCRRG